MSKCGRRKSSPFKLRKTTKGKGRTFLSTEEGAGMTKIQENIEIYIYLY